MTIVKDSGFETDDWAGDFATPDQLPANGVNQSVDLTSDANPEDLRPYLSTLAMIRVDFPSFADGRGFTIARVLRDIGFAGRLRAKGHVIADQYTMARRAGFDEVEIDADLAKRQPEDQWLRRANWTAHDYQNRLRA